MESEYLDLVSQAFILFFMKILKMQSMRIVPHSLSFPKYYYFLTSVNKCPRRYTPFKKRVPVPIHRSVWSVVCLLQVFGLSKKHTLNRQDKEAIIPYAYASCFFFNRIIANLALYKVN
jgi:hypothetical protein